MLRVRRELSSVRYVLFLDDSLSTSKSVDSPLFKLLKGNVCCWRICVKVETMGIVEVLVYRCRELLLAMVYDVSPLGVDSVKVLPQHDAVVLSVWTVMKMK